MPAAATYYPLPCHSTDTTAQQQAIDQTQIANAGDNSVIIQVQQVIQTQEANDTFTATSAAGGRCMKDSADDVAVQAQAQDLATQAGDRSIVIQNQNSVQNQFGNLEHGTGAASNVDSAQGLNQVQFGNAGDNSIVIQNQNTIQNQDAGNWNSAGHGWHPDAVDQAQGLNQFQFANTGDASVVIQNQNGFQNQFGNLHNGSGGEWWYPELIDQTQGLNQVQFASNAGSDGNLGQNQDSFQNQFALTNVEPHGYGTPTGHLTDGGSWDFVSQVQDLNQVQYANALGDGALVVQAQDAAQVQFADVTEPLVSMSLF